MAYAQKKSEHAFQAFHRDLAEGNFPPVLFMYGEEEYLIEWAVQSLAEKYTEEAILENTKRLMKYGGTLYNGVEDIIKELSKNYKLYIVSNCIEGYIESFLETSNLKEYFLDFENNGRTGLSKGDNINLLIRRNHLLNPIYVGDTDKDREASEYAGIPFVFASYGFGNVTKCDYKIDDISEMLTIFGEEK